MWAVIVLIIVLAVGGLWYASQSSSSPGASPVAAAPSTANPSPNPVAAPQQPATTGAVNAADTSNASLNAGLQQIDTQMQSANSAGASASSFNDTPVQQTE